MSKLETNTIDTISGSSTLTLGGTNLSTVNMASGVSPGTGMGKVLQVVSATDSTFRSTTSLSYVTASNTLSVNITPSSTSSKIFIVCSASTRVSNQAFYTIYRDSTNLAGSNGMVENYFDDSSGDNRSSIAMSILDTPSTTSQITYQLYFKNSAGTTFINHNNTKGSITAMEIAG